MRSIPDRAKHAAGRKSDPSTSKDFRPGGERANKKVFTTIKLVRCRAFCKNYVGMHKD